MSSKAHIGTNSRNTLMAIGTNVLIGFITLITGSLSARLLGVQGRGELAAIQITPFLSSPWPN